jgi:hypothetical protein
MGGDTITEPAREVDVIHETGVLVVGSGPSGLAAALAAARAGAEVTLLERFGCFGGNLTAVGVEGLAWYRHEQTVEAGGIAHEFEQRAIESGVAIPDSQSRSHEIDAEGFKLVADALVAEAGVRFSPFLRAPFQRAARDGLIDAELQTLAGTWGAVHDSGELTYLNVVHLAACDGTDPDSLTRFEIEGRRQAAAAIDAMRRYTPGCAGVRLRNFGMTIGIRDTRKLDAVYNLTEADDRGEGRFDDSVGIYPEFIDGYGVLVLPTTGRYMQIPYRSMLPRGVRQLLVAGRAIGGDRIAHAATRNMACCIGPGSRRRSRWPAAVSSASSSSRRCLASSSARACAGGRPAPPGRSTGHDHRADRAMFDPRGDRGGDLVTAEPCDQPQRQVKPRPGTAAGDDPAIVDDPGVRPHVGTGGLEVGQGIAVGDRRAPADQPGGGEQHRASADRRQHRAALVQRGQQRRQLRLGLSADTVLAVEPAAAGDQQQLRRCVERQPIVDDQP